MNKLCSEDNAITLARAVGSYQKERRCAAEAEEGHFTEGQEGQATEFKQGKAIYICFSEISR